MRIIFMGTPEWAVPSLEALVEGGQEIAAVVTRPDRPGGRGRRLAVPALKLRAAELGLGVLQPEKIAEPGFIRELEDLSADLIAVVAYGLYIPRKLWSLPPFGAINLHPSLLPRYRGAAPVQHAILNGDAVTGVTILQVGEKMDAGEIILQERREVLPDDTQRSLSLRLFRDGSCLLLRAVRMIEEGRASRTAQDDSLASYASKLGKKDGLIRWESPALRIERRVRALYPWPGAYTFMPVHGKKVLMKLREAGLVPGGAGEPGRLKRGPGGEVLVETGDGCLVLKKVQPEGKRVMDAEALLRGHRELEGARLG